VIKINVASIDASNADKFQSKMTKIISEQVDSEVLIIDLSNVVYMDSSGLSSLVSLLKYNDTNKKIVLSGLSQKVSKLFEITRMNKIFYVI